MRAAILALGILAFGGAARGDDAATREAIKRTALDYAESWYEGNPDKMERALHPDLAKRIVAVDGQGRSRLDHMGALSLVQAVRAGYGKKTPLEQQQKDVTVLDVSGNAATVKLVMAGWVDYLHIARFDDRWLIVNVLWERKPPASR
jgi:hypothetical protein